MIDGQYVKDPLPDSKCVGVIKQSEHKRSVIIYHDWRNKCFGHSLATNYNGNGEHNKVSLSISFIFVGITNDAGKTYSSDETLIAKYGLKTLAQALKENGAYPEVINKYTLNSE